MPTQPIVPIALEPDPLIGQRLGDFIVEQPLAAGGMGVVYRAKHPLIGRLAAIKVLKPEFAADREQTDRFLKEAQALSAIKHRGIIEIIGFGNTPDGRQYMATEFLDGESLEAVIAREAPMPPMRALALVDEVLQALSAAHKSSVVHRDLKPSNVFLSTQSTGERVVKLLDFGLAKQNPVTLANVADGVLAKASLVAGTPEYIAPEQARGLAPTPRTDLYCLGVMMFEMLSGTLPFKADTIVEMLKKQVYEEPPLLSGRVSNLPDALYDLVSQLLLKDPDQRPASAEIVRQTVNRLSKQLQQDSTVQRPNPLKVVPAPFRTAGPDAPTPPLDKRNIITEPVLRTPTADKLETELQKQGGRRPLFFGLAVLVLALLAFLLWPKGQPVTEVPVPPPPAPKPVEIAQVKPSPVEPPVAPVPVAVEEPLPSLPVSPTSPQPKPAVVVIEKKDPRVVVVANPACSNLALWKDDERERADDIATRVRDSLRTQGQSNDQIERVLATMKPIRARIDAAANGDECTATMTALSGWARQHGL